MFIIYYIYLHQKYTFVRMRQYNNTICILYIACYWAEILTSGLVHLPLTLNCTQNISSAFYL